MMWEREFLDYFASVPGGKYTDDECAAMWATSMVAYKNGDPSIIFYKGGPPKNPIRCRVEMGMYVNMGTDYLHQKAIESREKLKKDISDSDTASEPCLTTRALEAPQQCRSTSPRSLRSWVAKA